MFNYVKKKCMAFSDIFKDKNDYNEKNIVGFLSFAIMTMVAVTDIVTGIMGKEFPINDSIFNSFVLITLGAFGIDGLTKAVVNRPSRRHHNKEESDL